ncbi:MAG: hypothetical protein ABW194_09850 [Novosphingobium sp.]
MDAPIYPPAQVFVAPERVPRVLNTRDVSIADLMAIPEARAIVLKEMPQIESRLTGQIAPHLGNFSFRDISQYRIAKAEDLDRIDPQLARLGPVK